MERERVAGDRREERIKETRQVGDDAWDRKAKI